MSTSAKLRENSRVAVAIARAIGSNDRARSRSLAARGLALAFEAERIDRQAEDQRTAAVHFGGCAAWSRPLSKRTQLEALAVR